VKQETIRAMAGAARFTVADRFELDRDRGLQKGKARPSFLLMRAKGWDDTDRLAAA
jgi:hypothetical protein